ncbi:hypothetical protein [Oecophyllibacter saccharovorans]|uniref:Uncharacterized protein n=1 Tax=Oecophyllibacter saccharovorans TaxID=2558360 RepID=A0A506UKL4_9PROT|nr:hypothetical protein [Oecophyllibacter saccharovorans]TPW33866.1 hypothetical protein E3202_04540 [Oecophyllibacter saccharovorans]
MIKIKIKSTRRERLTDLKKHLPFTKKFLQAPLGNSILLSLENNPIITRNFIKNLRGSINEFLQHPHLSIFELIKINVKIGRKLSKCKNIDLCTSTLLDAEFSRWAIILHSIPSIAILEINSLNSPNECNNFWKNFVNSGYSYRKKINKNSVINHLCKYHLSKAFNKEDNPLEDANFLINECEKRLPSEQHKMLTYLSPALTEAIVNSLEHGYPDVSSIEFGRLACEISADQRWLEVVLVDLGESMCLPPKNCKDTATVENFMTLGRSRHQEAYRGNGSGDILAPCKNHPNNRVTVHSGRASVTYSQEGPVKRIDHREPIAGTIIHWKLQLVEDA